MMVRTVSFRTIVKPRVFAITLHQVPGTLAHLQRVQRLQRGEDADRERSQAISAQVPICDRGNETD